MEEEKELKSWADEVKAEDEEDEEEGVVVVEEKKKLGDLVEMTQPRGEEVLSSSRGDRSVGCQLGGWPLWVILLGDLSIPGKT